MVKQGSKWGTGNGKIFQVINVIEVDEHTWVYYRDIKVINEEINQLTLIYINSK